MLSFGKQALISVVYYVPELSLISSISHPFLPKPSKYPQKYDFNIQTNSWTMA